MTLSPAPTPAAGRARPRGPNYAARRMLVSTIAITLVVAAAVGAWMLTRDEEQQVTAAGGEWDQVALVDRATGGLITIDAEGVAGTAQAKVGRVTAMYASGDRVALVGSGQIVLTGVDEAAPVTIPLATGSTVTRLPVAEGLWLAVSKANGGNIVLVDGRTGNTIDVGALAGQASPRYFVETIRHDQDGTVFAIADAANFQTVVVRPGAVAATFLADQPLAVGGGFVVTSQVVGNQADVTLFDAERRDLASVPTPLPAGGIVDVDRDEAVIVTIDGGIYRFGKDDEEADRIGAVAVPTGGSVRSVHPTDGGERLLVIGDVFEAVIDLDGTTIFTTSFASQIAPPEIDPAWTCLPVGGGESYHSLIELESGEQLADLTGLAVSGVAADGCTVVGVRDQVTEVVGRDGSIQIGRVRDASLAPDGRAVIRQTTTGDTELVAIEDWKLGEPIDISADTPSNPLISFLQS